MYRVGELGIALILGGDIRYRTRVLTTAPNQLCRCQAGPVRT
ncbi:MAG: hypothetical protein ACP5HD_09630 [Thermoproteus sp.]